ncbi:MAG: DUF4097 domain-containing protein [Gemmatimonadota bacterium]|nr:DUF4097 domain-containing protein [Gemmatimonadota bacterium]
MAQHRTLVGRAAASVSVASLFLVTAASAQWRTLPDHEWCREQGDRDRGWHCEVREMTMAAPGHLEIDAGPNGGIAVTGSSRADVHVIARFTAWADSDQRARELVAETRIDVDGGALDSDGPERDRDESWSVSYRVATPRSVDLSVETTNGGIGISDVAGDIEFRTTNGGVTLVGLAGDVGGRTTNGSLTVELTGSEWTGDGMDVRTTNGAVRLLVPDGYSAHLAARTTNGGLHFDFPITVQGRLDRNIELDLGQGGRPISVRTTNGGVHVARP